MLHSLTAISCVLVTFSHNLGTPFPCQVKGFPGRSLAVILPPTQRSYFQHRPALLGEPQGGSADTAAREQPLLPPVGRKGQVDVWLLGAKRREKAPGEEESAPLLKEPHVLEATSKGRSPGNKYLDPTPSLLSSLVSQASRGVGLEGKWWLRATQSPAHGERQP